MTPDACMAIAAVLRTRTGRDVVRWLLSNFRPSTISGQMVSQNAALSDACDRVESMLWNAAPEEWHQAVVEAAGDRLEEINAGRDGDRDAGREYSDPEQ